MNEFNPRLAKWELETIDALASESLDKASRTEFIEHEDRFIDRFVTQLQARCLENTRERKRLVAQADRLGIGLAHPPKVAELQTEPYDVASKETAARWCRVINLVLTVERDHEWLALHHDLVTQHVNEARQTGIEWNPPDEGLGILQVLEDEAKRHGLISDEPAPEVDTRDLAERLLASLGSAA
jgi:hypothetical protein